MTLTTRKLVVLIAIGSVFLLANFLMVAHWLQQQGVIAAAGELREEFLTGTAITVILALLVLLTDRSRRTIAAGRSCPVCDERAGGTDKYCSACGSRL